MDFKKAFYSVDYKNLIDTLLSYGINGKVLGVVKSLYAKVESCVRGQDSLTNLFSCHRGVRQGCLLNPLLFTLSLNDFDSKINDMSTGDRLGDRNICTLLYADDLVLLANSADDLQSQLNGLNQFCMSIKMEANTSKTKIMVVKKNKKKSKACEIWKFGDKEIKECNEYKYLGVTFESNGSCSAHVDIIKQKAQKSYFALLSKSNEWDGFNPRLFLFLFDSTKLPILNYTTDVWGSGSWDAFKNFTLWLASQP